MEKWHEMNARHRRERIELVKSFAESRFTIKQSCKLLGVEENTLRVYAYREGIKFPKEHGGETSIRQYDIRTLSA